MFSHEKKASPVFVEYVHEVPILANFYEILLMNGMATEATAVDYVENEEDEVIVLPGILGKC